MSLISIAQKETFHISFVQFANQDYKADLWHLNSIKNTPGVWMCDQTAGVFLVHNERHGKCNNYFTSASA